MPARALIVNGPGNEFLAGSRLALDQNRGVGGATIRTAFRARRIPMLEPISSFSDRDGSRRGLNIVLAKVAMIQCLLRAIFAHKLR